MALSSLFLLICLFTAPPLMAETGSTDESLRIVDSGSTSDSRESEQSRNDKDRQKNGRQNGQHIQFSLNNYYTRVVREDFRVYKNDRSYSGFVYREQRAYLHELHPSIVEGEAIQASERSGGTLAYAGDNIEEKYFRGNVYVIKEISREGTRVAKPVDSDYEVTLKINGRGAGAFIGNQKIPFRTNYPLTPEEPVELGESWNGRGVEYIIGKGGELIEAPFRCTYTYKGKQNYRDRPALAISAEYGYYDRGTRDDNSDIKVRGKTEATILLYIDDEGGYFIRERVKRYLLGGDYGKRREEGFRLVWSEGFSNRHIDSMEEKIAQVLRSEKKDEKEMGDGSPREGSSGVSGGGKTKDSRGDTATGRDASGDRDQEEQKIEISRTEEGVKLNLPNIHFVPDQAKILPDERSRLDTLARMLRKVPDATFLVKGHTADVGTEKSQIALSKERAKTIIDELVDRGFAKTRFIYRGLGGSEPVASNETEAGRAKNRRVEIIILPK